MAARNSRGEDVDGAAVGRGPCRVIADLADGGLAFWPGDAATLDVALDAHALESEGAAVRRYRLLTPLPVSAATSRRS